MRAVATMASDNETAEDYWRVLSEAQAKEIERLRSVTRTCPVCETVIAANWRPFLMIPPEGFCGYCLVASDHSDAAP
jgi:hypothetical protein